MDANSWRELMAVDAYPGHVWFTCVCCDRRVEVWSDGAAWWGSLDDRESLCPMCERRGCDAELGILYMRRCA